ncbi:MAG: DNA repair protein RecO [Endomicrobiales bacterium]
MYYQLRGLVLRSQVSAEADKLLTLYTHEWGKITALVPGAKKIKAKFSAATEPVTESEFMVYLNHPSARPKVTGARLVNSFPALRRDWRRFTVAQYCSEISEVLTPFNAENPKKYELLLRTWALLAEARYPWRIFVAFCLRFLKLSGYSFVEFLRGERTGVSDEEQRVIQQLSTLSGEEIDRKLEIEPQVEKEVRAHLESYLNTYLPRPLATREFWNKVGIAHRGRPHGHPAPADSHKRG